MKMPPFWHREEAGLYSRAGAEVEVYEARGSWWFKPPGKYAYGPFRTAVSAMRDWER